MPASLDWIRQRILDTAVRWASRRPEQKHGLIAALQGFARYREREPFEKTKRPPGIALEPLYAEYYALFSMEELDGLRAGLHALLRRTPDRLFAPTRDRASLDQWLAQCKSGAHSGGWAPLHRVILGATEDEREWAGPTYVQVWHVLPSYMCVGVRVWPTERLKQELTLLLSRDASDQSRIVRLPIPFVRRRGYGYSSIPARMVREREWIELWGHVERVVRRVLSREFMSTWAREGRLPSVRALALVEGTHGSESTESRHFWSSIGLDPDFADPYRVAGLTVTRSAPTYSGAEHIDYQVLVDRKAFLAGRTGSDGFATEDDALVSKLDSALEPLVPVLAIRSHADRMASQATRVRNEVVPALTSHRYSWRQLRRTLRHLSTIAALTFDLRRMREEMRSARRWLSGEHHLAQLQRRQYDTADPATLRDDLKWQTDHRWETAQQQLDLLNASHGDRVNMALQRRVYWLTVITTILTAVGAMGLVPVEARDRALEWVMGLFGK